MPYAGEFSFEKDVRTVAEWVLDHGRGTIDEVEAAALRLLNELDLIGGDDG